MSTVTAVLADIMSIQRYVYASNRLKENIGASNIVTKLYTPNIVTNIVDGSFQNVLQNVLQQKINLSAWEENPEKISITNPGVNFEVGYIGGGNALLFFRDKATAEVFIKEWTRNLLVVAPGLNTAFAVSQFNLADFKNEKKKLHKKLEQNKSNYFLQTFLPKHGITADCPYSGYTAEVYKQPESYDEEAVYISAVSYAKYENRGIDKAKSYVEEATKGMYTCTTDVAKLGQTKGQNHIATVHIDGNDIGEQFKACKDLVETRKLSIKLKKAMESVNKDFLDYAIAQTEYLRQGESGFGITKEDGKYIVPFRPILVGGDEITFLTDGRLGVPFAEKYLQLMSEKILQKDKKLTACGGVAITKTKYPFFRSYKLAEELCQCAKNAARAMAKKKKENTCWLDFHIAYGGFSGTLTEIRKNKYTLPKGQLHFGPYLVANSDKSNEKNIVHLKEGIKVFLDNEQWPRSKMKEFREYLTLGQAASEKLIEEAGFKGRELYDLPETGKGYNVRIWQNGFTPYFNMIELLDFYPKHMLADVKAGE